MVLYFLLDNSSEFGEADEPKPTPQRIKKAVVFFDTKKEMHSCLDTLRIWLEVKKGYSTGEADNLDKPVAEYHATLRKGEYTKNSRNRTLEYGYMLQQMHWL